MTDLLLNRESLVRMSSSGSCKLKIAHKMTGTEPEPGADSNMIAMLMGTALEPVIIKALEHHGMQCDFTGYDQLQVALDNPYRVGHLDGLAALPSDPAKWSWWITHNLPASALERFEAGEVMMLEIKTMGDDYFKDFVSFGLKGNVLIEQYLDQVYGYNAALLGVGTNELWPDGQAIINGKEGDNPNPPGADAFKAYLDAHDAEPPTATLVVGMNPRNKRLAFETIPFDQERFDQISSNLAGMVEGLHAGIMPEPDHDGKAQECFWCEFKQHCPMAQEIREEVNVDDMLNSLDISSPVDDAIVNDLASRYAEARTGKKEFEEEMETIKQEYKDRIGLEAIRTSDYSISLREQKGNLRIDSIALEKYVGQFVVSGLEAREMAKELDIDEDRLLRAFNKRLFEIPKARNKSSERIHVTPLFGPTSER